MASAQQWYMAIGGHQVGPVSADEIVSNIRNGSMQPGTFVFTPGMTDWTPVGQVGVFAPYFQQVAAPAPIPAAPGRMAHEIDFKVFGQELQFVEVELDPGESAIAEAGAMMYMTQGIEMNTVFGDGSGTAADRRGDGQAPGRGETAAHGREPVHDDLHQLGAGQTAGRLRGSLCG